MFRQRLLFTAQEPENLKTAALPASVSGPLAEQSCPRRGLNRRNKARRRNS
jgi:hypothetical protein